MFKNLEKRKIYGTILGVIGFVLLALSISYAFYLWNSNDDNTNVNLTISKGLDGLIIYNHGNPILSTDNVTLTLGDNYTSGISTTIEFWKKETVTKTIYGQLSMKILDLQTKDGTSTNNANIAKCETVKWAITTYTTTNTTETLLAEGNFKDRQIDDVFSLVTNIELNPYQTYYKVYIWLDTNAVDGSNPISGELISTLITAEASDTMSRFTEKIDNSGANYPVLTDGLIPVVYNGSNWVKADTESSTSTYGWYDYDQKKWANAVLIKETQKSYDNEQITSNKSVSLTSSNLISVSMQYIIDEETDSYYLLMADEPSYTIDELGGIINEGQLYTCSDLVSSRCTTLYEIKEVSSNTITKVNELTLGKSSTAQIRSKYSNVKVGDVIEDEDIAAFYVWIPRFKYKVWNMSKQIGNSTYDAYNTGIDIVFEDGTDSTGTISCTYTYNVDPSAGGINLSNELAENCTDSSNTRYYTHPAFTFGDQELKGFWMGKFELSSSSPSEGIAYGGAQLMSLTPRIIPNVTSWRNNTVSNFWKVIYDMQKENNIYGLPTSRTNTDSHMITNMEWGAVAYLTNSKYGRCTNGSCVAVASNSYSSDYDTNDHGTTRTGCGPFSSESNRYSNTCNAYNTTIGQLASTTGNIYGVYDMSGGTYEYVMGNMSSASGTTYTYNVSSAGTNFAYSTDTAKYLISYAYGTTYYDQAAYNRGRLGDATSEILLQTSDGTEGWYGDSISFLGKSSTTNFSWFSRGGSFWDYESNSEELFTFSSRIGQADNIISTRAVLTVAS